MAIGTAKRLKNRKIRPPINYTSIFLNRLLWHTLVASSAVLFATIGLSAKKASQPDKGANKYQDQENFLDHDTILSSNASRSHSAFPAAQRFLL